MSYGLRTFSIAGERIDFEAGSLRLVARAQVYAGVSGTVATGATTGELITFFQGTDWSIGEPAVTRGSDGKIAWTGYTDGIIFVFMRT